MQKKPFNGTQLGYRNQRHYHPCLNLPHLLYYPVRSCHWILTTYRMQITYNPTMRSSWLISGLVSNDCQTLLTHVYLTSICYLATMVDGPHADIIQPYALRAPEVILGNGWHTSADIWNLGCLVSNFFFSNFLTIQCCVTVRLTLTVFSYLSFSLENGSLPHGAGPHGALKAIILLICPSLLGKNLISHMSGRESTLKNILHPKVSYFADDYYW